MEAKAFGKDEETTLTLERKNLRTFISLCHSEMLGNKRLDIDTIKTKFTRLCEVESKFISNILSEDGDAEKEMEQHAKYSGMMQEMINSFAPKVVNTRPADVKLPKVVENDPASWRSFKLLLEMSFKHQAV